MAADPNDKGKPTRAKAKPSGAKAKPSGAKAKPSGAKAKPSGAKASRAKEKPTRALPMGEDGAHSGGDISSARVGVIVAGVLAILLVGWLVLRGNDDSSSVTTASGGGPEAATVGDLRELAASRAMPIYWAGPQGGADLEVTETNEDVYVRYLAGGAQPGDESAQFLTVGTYAFPNAVSALKKQSREPGGVLASAPGGAAVFFSRNNPRSVYLAFPGIDVEIEVYDPDPRRALSLVTSGQIVPVS